MRYMCFRYNQSHKPCCTFLPHKMRQAFKFSSITSPAPAETWLDLERFVQLKCDAAYFTKQLSIEVKGIVTSLFCWLYSSKVQLLLDCLQAKQQV